MHLAGISKAIYIAFKLYIWSIFAFPSNPMTFAFLAPWSRPTVWATAMSLSNTRDRHLYP